MRRRKNGAIRFISEMIGITNGKSAAAAGLMAICWLGMHAGMKIMDDNRYIEQQRDMGRYIEHKVHKEMYNQRKYYK